MDLSAFKGNRTYLLMLANMVCVILENFGIIPEGTWAKVTTVLVSLGLMATRAGSKNDAAKVEAALSSFSTGGLTPNSDNILASLGTVVEEYKTAKVRMDQLKAVMIGLSEEQNIVRPAIIPESQKAPAATESSVPSTPSIPATQNESPGGA